MNSNDGRGAEGHAKRIITLKRKKGDICPFQTTAELIIGFLSGKVPILEYKCKYCLFYDKVIEKCAIDNLKTKIIEKETKA